MHMTIAWKQLEQLLPKTTKDWSFSKAFLCSFGNDSEVLCDLETSQILKLKQAQSTNTP